MIQVGNKYHKDGKVYTVYNCDNFMQIELRDSCNKPSFVTASYLVSNYSGLPSNMTLNNQEIKQ